MSSPTTSQPPMSTMLQQAGYRPEPFKEPNITPVSFDKLRIMQLSDNATTPTKATPGSAGIDFYSSESVIIPPGKQYKVHTDICVEIPSGHYGQLKSRSGLSLNHRLNVNAGVIDSDY